jgi:hypothetical protein
MTALEESAPSAKWGVFDLAGLSGEVHAVPIYENGYPRLGHTLSLGCACQPRIEKFVYFMVGHKEID